MLCAAEQDRVGWRRGNECREPPDTVPSPPETPTTEHSDPPQPSPPRRHAIAHAPAVLGRFGFSRCLAGPGGRRVSRRPLPESGAGLGYSDSAQRNAITAAAGGGGLQRAVTEPGQEVWGVRAGRDGGKRGLRGGSTTAGPREMSLCPHGGGQRLSLQPPPATTPRSLQPGAVAGSRRLPQRPAEPLPLQSRFNYCSR